MNIKCSYCGNFGPCKEPDCHVKSNNDKGIYSTHHCTVAGGTSSGKTYYIIVLLQELIKIKTIKIGEYKLTFSFINDKEKDKFIEHRNNLRLGIINPTVQQTGVEPYALHIHALNTMSGKETRKNICFYNTAGELFQSIDNTKKNISLDIRESQCCIYMIDPEEDKELSALIPENKKGKKQHNENCILEDLANKWMDINNWNHINNPIAICINKFDLVHDSIIPKKIENQVYIDIKPNHKISWNDIDTISTLLERNIIDKQTILYDVNSISEKFKSKKYFATAPIGHNDDEKIQLSSKGVLTPFFWLLKSIDLIN